MMTAVELHSYTRVMTSSCAASEATLLYQAKLKLVSLSPSLFSSLFSIHVAEWNREIE